MEYGFLSLVPALVTIFIAFYFHKVTWALFIGIVSGCLILSSFSPVAFVGKTLEYVWFCVSSEERLKISFFILIVGGLLEVLAVSGAYNTFADWISKYLNSPKKTRIASFLTGLAIFFDDYANILISGAAMKGIAKKNKLTPAYIAYIVDNTAIFASVTVISTWAAYEGSLMLSAGHQVGLKLSATHYLISTLPYNFFIYFSAILVFLTALSGKWFGKRFENERYTFQIETHPTKNKAKLKHFMVPIGVLVFLSITSLFVVGYIRLKLKNTEDVNEDVNIVNILGNAPTIDILIVSTAVSIMLSLYLLRKHKVIGKKTFATSFHKGFKEMVSAAFVIVWANGLSEISNVLGTGNYIANHLKVLITPGVLPAIIFFISFIITIATGFSWSSMAIVMPIAFTLAKSYGLPIESNYILASSVIGGSIAGGLLIPYSDTSVMTSSALNISATYHVKTHFLQVVTVFCVACIAYLFLGFGFNIAIIYLVSILIIYVIHKLFSK